MAACSMPPRRFAEKSNSWPSRLSASEVAGTVRGGGHYRAAARSFKWLQAEAVNRHPETSPFQIDR